MENVSVPGPGSVIGGRYRLVRQLGAGGMGAVWLAEHVQLGSEVAIKVMAPDVVGSSSARARFEREAKIAAQLSHANIVHVQDYGIEGSLPFLVMERLVGEDLGERLKREGRIAPAEMGALAVQIGRGLRRMHDAGIVHRDLKPANVFLTKAEDGEVHVKLLDLGIVKTATATDGESTRTGEIMGSPHYMSPEQVQNAKSIGVPSDLWSFGVLLFRALTGRQPFRAEGMGPIIAAILTSPIPVASSLAPDLPPEIDRFFERALARDPAERFQSAREMVDELLVALGVRAPASSLTQLSTQLPASLRAPASPATATPIAAAPAAAAPVPDTLISLFSRTGAHAAPRRRVMLIGSLSGLGVALALAWALWAPSAPGAGQSGAEHGALAPPPPVTMAPEEGSSAAPAGSAEVAPAGVAEAVPAGSADAGASHGLGAAERGAPATSEHGAAPHRGSQPQEQPTKDGPEGPLRPPKPKRSLGF